MPNHTKLVLSVLVALVAIGAHVFQARADQDPNAWPVLGLGMFMIVAMWLFPEAKGRSSRTEPIASASAGVGGTRFSASSSTRDRRL